MHSINWTSFLSVTLLLMIAAPLTEYSFPVLRRSTVSHIQNTKTTFVACMLETVVVCCILSLRLSVLFLVYMQNLKLVLQLHVVVQCGSFQWL